MQIKALIFDFDGLILDTETPDVHAWENIYAEYGFPFPLESWAQIIGGTGASTFNAAVHLQGLLSDPLDLDDLQKRQTHISHSLVDQQTVMPGVMDYLHEAKRLGLRLAIASSSMHSWVDTHAKRLGVFDYFDKVICADDVGVGRTKPNPDLFLLALDQLKVRKNEAIVFEDSPNGVRAARSAGIFVVAVPNQVTSLLSIEHANLTLRSLADLSLSELLNKVQ
ncbi:MAG TPA: HAD family phosphatase [Anaerolineales bacterium]|nr:HAD family phosphatase [Anaerolineales bacterium]